MVYSIRFFLNSDEFNKEFRSLEQELEPIKIKHRETKAVKIKCVYSVSVCMQKFKTQEMSSAHKSDRVQSRYNRPR